MNKGSSKHIAIATSAVVVVGAFGAGAFALAQADPSFNPDNFASAYSKGLDDANKGYQANPIDTDGQANRNKENADNTDKSTDGQQTSQDAFSTAPQQGPSGTTAYNLTGNTEQGGLTIANGSGTGAAGGNGSSTANGPVIAPVDGGNTNGNGAGNNGGTQPAPAPAPTPWQPTYNEFEPQLPDEPAPKKPNVMDSDPINDSNKNLANIDQSLISVTIWQTYSTDYQLYAGQTLDDWTVFCGIEAYFSYLNEDYELQTAEWRCSQEQFATYPYFQIVSRPDVAPDEPFDITVRYRVTTNDEWQYETINYTPAPSRTYILSTTLDENGKTSILFSYSDNDINLFMCNNSLMRDSGYLLDDGALTRLLLGWRENDQDVDFFYQPNGAGRHYIAPGRFANIPDGYTMKLKNVWMNPDYTGAPLDGSKPCSLQTLTGVSSSASCMLVPDLSGRYTLSTTPGIQAINIEAEPVTIDCLEVSGSVWYINAENGLLRVNDAYSVDSSNPNYASLSNGILTNKRETEYLGIPLSFKTLDVAEGIQSVNFTKGNNLQRVTLNAAHAGEIPVGNWENLSNCNVVVDDAIFDAFSAANRDVFDISTGNTISMKSDPSTRYCFSNNTLISDDEAVYFVDTGVDLVRVTNAHTLTTGCLENCPNITTLVLTDSEAYWLENGCLAGSNVRTIVCSTDEQVDYVFSRLQAAGASEDVYVTKAVTSDEGYRYFDNIDDLGFPAVTLFEVPDSTRTFNGVGNIEGYPLAFSAIAPATFENHPNLEWVNLADSVDHIGASAFAGCSKLQGVFIANDNAITVGEGAFANCENTRFIASNAMTGNFASDEKPNDACLMYAPTNCIGYHIGFTSFTEESGVAEYAVDQQEDGSLVLSGCDADGSEWLLLAAGNEMNGNIKLSPDVIEIFSNAFAGTKGTFTINWDELPNLQYVDAGAFANSGLSGDVYLGSLWADRGVIGDQAFSTCPGITSFTSETAYFILGNLAFENCTGLEHATLAAMGDYDNAIWPGLFSGCNNLQDITFTGWSPVSLTLFGTGLPFLFNSEMSYEEEEASLRLNVPDYAQETYLETWLYAMVGGTDFKTYYRSCYKELLAENNDIIPSDYEVKERMSQGLLRAENHMRTMMGMPLVDSSSFLDVAEKDGFEYELQNGTYMLISAPEDATVIDFNDIVPDGVDVVGIDVNAFANCSNIERIVLTDQVATINMNAFAGCDGATVQLPETVSATLAGGLYYQPFTFGADVKLEVPQGCEEAYLSAWTRQCLGIPDDSKDSMDTYATNIMFDKWDIFFGTIPTADELNEAVNTPLMEQENYLRGLMGLDPISSLDEALCYYDASGLLDIYQPEPDPFPDWPEWPDWGDDDPWADDPWNDDPWTDDPASDDPASDSDWGGDVPGGEPDWGDSTPDEDGDWGGEGDPASANPDAGESDLPDFGLLAVNENRSEQAAGKSAPATETTA